MIQNTFIVSLYKINSKIQKKYTYFSKINDSYVKFVIIICSIGAKKK